MPSGGITVKVEGSAGRLTKKQADFLAHYAVYGVGTKAALAAGVPEESAGKVAWAWLNNPSFAHVRAELDLLLERQRQECNVEKQKITAMLMEVLTFNPKSIVDPKTGAPLPLHKLSLSAARAVAEYEIVTEKVPVGKKPKKGKQRFKTRRYLVPHKQWDFLKALKQLCELHGLNAPKKVDMSGHVGIGIDWLLRAPRDSQQVAEEMERRLNEPLQLPPPDEPGK